MNCHTNTLFFNSHLKNFMLINRCMHFINTSWTFKFQREYNIVLTRTCTKVCFFLFFGGQQE
ncbi:hypothetical protein NC653_035213 [Populus alba x Populus x berolinensis]|uniref:Uncharacterized protein n=1 Tax=Populus alba x Populus x berolinensis TaxID=444605 RepID=A0AAD6PX34_9ROSI|nr:hypothetical protein NC653_035213 [Populus alba x Populus x berolinensis]